MGDGLDDALSVDRCVAKGMGEERGIFGVPLQFGHHAVPILAHFHGRLYYFEGLVFKAGCAPVPEKGPAPERVKKRHGVATGGTAGALAEGPAGRRRRGRIGGTRRRIWCYRRRGWGSAKSRLPRAIPSTVRGLFGGISGAGNPAGTARFVGGWGGGGGQGGTPASLPQATSPSRIRTPSRGRFANRPYCPLDAVRGPSHCYPARCVLEKRPTRRFSCKVNCASALPIIPPRSLKSYRDGASYHSLRSITTAMAHSSPLIVRGKRQGDGKRKVFSARWPGVREKGPFAVGGAEEALHAHVVVAAAHRSRPCHVVEVIDARQRASLVFWLRECQR